MSCIEITFSENRVDCRSKNLGIDSLNGLFLSILRVGWIVRDIITLGLELSNTLQQLRDRGRDVGQLDDVSLRGLGELSKSCKFIRDSLVWLQSIRKVCNKTSSN